LNISTVLFDLDGTLIDSFAAIQQSLETTFSEAGLTGASSEDYLQYLSTSGGQLAVAFKQLELEQGSNLNLMPRYRKAYWNKEPGLVNLYPGVEDMLGQLKAMDMNLGLVTQKNWSVDLDGQLVGAARELEELGVLNLFSAGVGFENVTNYKPHPEGVFLALRQLGVKSGETILVGDSLADMKAGRSAGCSIHLATWGHIFGTDASTSINVDYILEKPSDLIQFLSDNQIS
jgi:HAD superfamily hydrolase (TIGR01509 family)